MMAEILPGSKYTVTLSEHSEYIKMCAEKVTTNILIVLQVHKLKTRCIKE